VNEKLSTECNSYKYYAWNEFLKKHILIDISSFIIREYQQNVHFCW